MDSDKKPVLKVISLNEEIPKGWRLLNDIEALQYLEMINNEVSNYSQWYIYALCDGKKIDGPGYGNKIHETYGKECGQKLIGKIESYEEDDISPATLLPLQLI